jgi:riboflavin kinase/FMN adenylyltransferase
VRLLKAIPSNSRILGKTVLTIGVFDGVHRGHQPILRRVVRQARNLKAKAVALTFDGHPTQVISPSYSPPMLASTGQKLEWLAQAGLDAVILIRFDRGFASQEAGAFVDQVLVKRLGVREVVVGYDFVFGRQGLGNLATLKEAAGKQGFKVSVVPPVEVDGAPVSSTRIRSAILAGDMRAAGRLLGRPYVLTGKVVRGAGRGAKLNYPTANLAVEQELLPKPGVWGGRVQVDRKGRWLPFIANIGTNPTFVGGKKLSVELHLLDFQGALYGKQLEAEFQHYLRPEKKFDGPAQLVVQIQKDEMVFRQWLKRQGSA